MFSILLRQLQLAGEVRVVGASSSIEKLTPTRAPLWVGGVSTLFLLIEDKVVRDYTSYLHRLFVDGRGREASLQRYSLCFCYQ